MHAERIASMADAVRTEHKVPSTATTTAQWGVDTLFTDLEDLPWD